MARQFRGKTQSELIQIATEKVKTASSMVILTGAGMGVDSGLPDFRGKSGFWKEYPVIAKLGLDFSEMANPVWFQEDPTLAWGFYGHRLNLYRKTLPHKGYSILKSWLTTDDDKKTNIKSTFSFTSNVDGHFLKAQYDPETICEVHGSINFAQCSNGATSCPVTISDGAIMPMENIWPADRDVPVNLETLRIPEKEVPRCTTCRSVMRPNILLFGDWGFLNDRQQLQLRKYHNFRYSRAPGSCVVFEIGAGASVPTIRMQSQELSFWDDTTIIRINPGTAGESSNDDEGGRFIHLKMGALDGITAIDSLL